ncbi:hypothetical protein JCM10908_005391 [Rhodotorula pacifica]|uniref:uncharacterized protein n=1 Tax=Rhodotorula pacifica TaxID=1495444 RepID=UPI0031752CA8
MHDESASAFASLIQRESAQLRSAPPREAIPLDIDDALSYGASLKGKVVIVTGAGSGFGRAYARKLGEIGAKVALSDYKKHLAQEVADEIVAKGGTATAVACDVIDWDAQVRMFRHAVETYGHIDVVVANAGIGEPPSDRFMDLAPGPDGEPTKPTLRTLGPNLNGVAYTAKLAFFHLDKNPVKEGKTLVVLGSIASFIGLPGGPVYGASKHAVLGLVRSLVYDGMAFGINVNIVNPFFVKTNIFNTVTTLLLAGIPLPTIDDVVAAMIAASSKPKTSGSAFVVDFKGILELPSTAAYAGTGNFYEVFGRRAAGGIIFGKWLSDIVSAVFGAFSSQRR